MHLRHEFEIIQIRIQEEVAVMMEVVALLGDVEKKEVEGEEEEKE